MNGTSAIHQCIINNNINIFAKLLDTNININLQDFFGYTPLHYILVELKTSLENNDNKIQLIKFLKLLLNNKNLSFNLTNINGEIPLHLLLSIYKNIKIEKEILEKFVVEY
jgi:ankyrin repeat protein